MVGNTSKEDFMAKFKEQEAKDRGTSGTGEFEERTTLKAERDTPYTGYYIESYQSGIEGNFGPNTAVRVTSPSGEKQTLWVNNFEEKHFLQFISRLEKDNGVTVDDKGTLSPPVKVDFMRSQQESEEGRKYNRIMFILVDSGEDVQNELDSL